MKATRAVWAVPVVCWVLGFTSCGERSTDPGNDGGGEAFQVETESFSQNFDVPESSAITRTYCSTASGKYVVTGMDRPDEWIEIEVTVPASGTYDVTIRYAAPKDSTIEIRMNAEACGAEEADFTLDKGQRIG